MINRFRAIFLSLVYTGFVSHPRLQIRHRLTQKYWYVIQRVQSDVARGFEVKLGRANLKDVNPKYIKNAYFNVRRISKRGGYISNARGILQQTLGNNITV